MKDEKALITRRDFMQGTIGAALATSLFGFSCPVQKANAMSPSMVTVVRDKNAIGAARDVDLTVLEKMLENTLKKVTHQNNVKKAWMSLVKPDDIIGLVPTPHLNPTHDEVVDAVTNSLEEAGIPKDRILNAQGSPRKPKKCTALIALPGLKAHWLTGIGTVLKNYIMFSGSPSRYHGRDSAKLGEIWNLPFVKGKTKLVLVDALYPLCDKGPQPDPRYQWNYNGLIAGTDPVATETVCLNIITAKRNAIRKEPWPLSPPPICVEAADKVYKLGTSKMENIRINHFGWDEDLLL